MSQAETPAPPVPETRSDASPGAPLRPAPIDDLGLTAADVGRRCLVTGGTGYLGRHLVHALLELGCEVRSLDVVPPLAPRPGVDEITGDICDPIVVRRACAGVDTVFHAAAVIELLGVARRSVRDRVFAINVGGTQNVIDASQAGGVQRLVFTSSVNVVIDREVVEIDESARYAQTFVDLYTESKVAAEKALLAADEPGRPGGLRTVAIRPGGIWGPGEGCLMMQIFLEQLATGRLVALVGDGTAVADCTHVWNLVRGELLAAARLGTTPARVGGQAYFITDDERINGVEWFRPVVEALGYEMPTRRVPGRLIYGVAWLLECVHALGGPEPPLTRIAVLKLIRTSSCKIDRARADLGYEPIVRCADGLLLHLDDYRAKLMTMTNPTNEPMNDRDATASESVPEGWRDRDDDGRAKYVFCLRDDSERDGARRREDLLERAVPALRAAGARGLALSIADDEAAKVRSPNPLTKPWVRAVVNLWSDGDPARFAEILADHGFEPAGYRVAESIYRDYGDNEHAGPRDWPPGERSPGISAISLLQRPKKLDRDEWVTRWHERMSAVSERIQPRTRYVRNLVLEPVTPDAPPLDGLVEEAWPSAKHVESKYLFYGASNVFQLAKNMTAIVRAASSFLQMWKVHTAMMSEYLLEP